MKSFVIFSILFFSSLVFARNEYEQVEWKKATSFVDGLDQIENEMGMEESGDRSINVIGSSTPSTGQEIDMSNPPGQMGAIPAMIPGMNSGGFPQGFVPPPMPPGVNQNIPLNMTKEEAAEYGRAFKELRDKHKDNNFSNEYINDAFSEIERIQKEQKKLK